MNVSVRLFGDLGYTVEQNPVVVTLAEGDTVAQVVAHLGLRPGDVWLVKINDRATGMDTPVQEGDEVTLIPPIGGGY